jgi:hypothetical protein
MAAGDLNATRGGIANSGTVSGGVTISDGAMVFDGVNGLITATALTQVAVNETYTISAWIKTSADHNDGVIFMNNQNDNNRVNLVITSANNRIAFGTYNGTTTNGITHTQVLTPETWYHIVAISNGHTSKTIYVNNVSASGGVGGLQYNSGTGLRMGLNSVNVRPYNGSSNIVIFSKALSASEISSIYNAGKDAYSPVTTGLVAQYSGRDFAGTEATPTRIYNNIVAYDTTPKTLLDNVKLTTATDKLVYVQQRNDNPMVFAVEREA